MEVVQPMSTEQGESEERRPRAHWLPFTHSFLICNVFVTFHVRYLVDKHKKCSKFKEKSGLCAVITRMPLVFFLLLFVLCAGLKPNWLPLWPAAGSNTISCPLSVSCQRVWRRSSRGRATFHFTHGSTRWRAGQLSMLRVHAHLPKSR